MTLFCGQGNGSSEEEALHLAEQLINGKGSAPCPIHVLTHRLATSEILILCLILILALILVLVPVLIQMLMPIPILILILILTLWDFPSNNASIEDPGL